MISHDNLNMLQANIDKSIIPRKSKILSYLPTSHIASLSLDVFIVFINGGCTYFCGQDALKGNLGWYLQSVRPNVFLGVPRIYEKIQDKIETQLKESNFIKQKIFSWSRSIIEKEILQVLEGKPPSIQYRYANRIMDKLK